MKKTADKSAARGLQIMKISDMLTVCWLRDSIGKLMIMLPLQFILNNIDSLRKKGLRDNSLPSFIFLFEKMAALIGEKMAEASLLLFLNNCNSIVYQEDGGFFNPELKTLSLPTKDWDVAAYPIHIFVHEVFHAIRVSNSDCKRCIEEPLAMIFQTILVFTPQKVLNSTVVETIQINDFLVLKGYWIDIRNMSYAIMGQLLYCVMLLAGFSIDDVNERVLDYTFQPIEKIKDAFPEKATEIIYDFDEAFTCLESLFSSKNENEAKVFTQASIHYINSVLFHSLIRADCKEIAKYREQIKMFLPLSESAILPQFVDLLDTKCMM